MTPLQLAPCPDCGTTTLHRPDSPCAVLTAAGPRPRCRCTHPEYGPCPNVADDDDAPYCADCFTARVYAIAECTHDAHDL